MEIKVGFVHTPRDLVVNAAGDKDALVKDLRTFLDDLNAGSFLIEDDKGKKFLIVRNEVAYIEFGAPEQVTVGFAS